MKMSAELVGLKLGRVFPDATSRVHINPNKENLGFGTKPTDAARNSATIRGLQTRGHLEDEFFGNSVGEYSGTSPYVNKTLKNGNRVGMIGSDVGYFEINGVVVATDLPQLDPDELVRRQHEVVPAQLPRHLNESLRLAYTASILAMLYVADQQATETQKAVALQHLTPDITRPHLKYPRSIPLAHSTVGAYDLRTFSPGVKKSGHLEAEQAVVDPDYNALMALSLYGYISAALRETEFEGRGFEVKSRTVEPYGYEMVVDLPTDQLLTADSIRLVSTILDLQHDGYLDFYRQHGSRRPLHIVGGDRQVHRRKPQPSSRDYIIIGEDSVLRIIKSPIEYSHSGAVEAAGAVLLRNPDYESLEEPEVIQNFRKSAAEEIEKAIEIVSFV